MGKLMLTQLLREGVEVDLYLPLLGGDRPPVGPSPLLRIIEWRSRWRWDRWYSNTKQRALFTSLATRSLANMGLGIRLLIEHRRHPYDVVYQLSTTELFVIGRLRPFAPPIVVHPCTHAAGELRWHRAEQKYALRSERRSTHALMRALLMLRSHLQPRELARADMVVGLSERFNELLHEDYGVPRAKLRVIRTPVDVQRFTSFGPERPTHPRTLLFISRISTRKGVEEVIELSHRLDDLAGSVRMLVIGGPTQWSDYRAHLARLNANVAQYVGGVPSLELPALMRSATMLIVPSRYEPGSIVTAEALACGLPVVLSDEVGAGEVVGGPHVRFHRAGDVDGLEAGVRSLLGATERDEPRLRATARANAEEQFAPQVVVPDLIRVLRSQTVRAGRPTGEKSTSRTVPQGRSSNLKHTIKAAMVPRRAGPRTIRAGIARGVRMHIDFHSQTRLYLGLYELELDRHLRRILRPGMAAFDVGAQHGYASLAIAKHTRAPVAAFDSDAACLAGLRRSVALNPELAPFIQPIEATVGSGQYALGLDEWAYNGGFIPDFIKIDIEGGELDALRSAERILRERRPSLIVEVHSEDLEREAGRLLVESGYRPLVVSQRRLLPDRRWTGQNRWLVAC